MAIAGNCGGPDDDGQLPALETETLDSSVGGKNRQEVKSLEDSMNKRAKVRGRALIFEQMRTLDREKLLPKNVTIIKEQIRTSDRENWPLQNVTIVKEDEKQQESGSRFKIPEVVRQERSQEDALDDLKMKNIKTILMKLLNKTGLGRYMC